MKLTIYADTTEDLRVQVANLARFLGFDAPASQVPEPTPITNGAPSAARGRGRPPKAAPVDTTAAASAGSPAAPAPTMLPMCSTHAPLYPDIKPIPAEPAACVKCAAAAKGPNGKPMSLDEVKAVANELAASRPDGWDICFRTLDQLGAESLTGAVDPDTGEPTKALDPAKYEEFARLFSAAMAPKAEPAKPARKSL